MEITHASITALTTAASPFRPDAFKVERMLDRPASGSGDARGQSARITFMADYPDALFAFVQAIAGVDETIGGVTAKVPLRFPDTPAGTLDLFADRYSWRAVGGRPATVVVDPPPDPLPAILAPGPAGTGWNSTHVYAEVDVSFSIPEFNFADSVLTSRRNRIGARIVTIPGAPYRYAPAATAAIVGKPINQDTGVILPTQEIRYTRHWVPSVEAIEAAVLPLVYHTNVAPMTIGGVTWPAGCVLFGGIDTDEQRGGFGSALTSRVDYSFLVDWAGWDKVMSDLTGIFEPVIGVEGTYIYPRGDLTQITTL